MHGHYQLAGLAVAKTRQTRRWDTIDIELTPLNELIANYRQLEVPLTDFYGADKTLDLFQYEGRIRDSRRTLPQWLNDIGHEALQLTDGHPSLIIGETRYVPLTLRKGTFKMAKAGYHPSHEVAVEDYDDLVITYDDIAPADLHYKCLFTINGLVVPTTYHQYGCRLKYAGDIIRKSGRMDAGLLSFEHIGTIAQVPITADNIHKVSEQHTYFDRILIDVRQNINRKTVGLVLGGHLHLLDNVVSVIGDNTIAITLRNSRYVERVLETQDTLDLEMMGLDDIDSQSVMSHVTSDNAIHKYLTSPYSFLVLIDNPDLMVDKTGVSLSAKMGSYVVPIDRTHSRLVDHLGRGIEYWPVRGEFVWALCGVESHRQTYMHHDTDWLQLVRMNGGAAPYRPVMEIEPTMIHYRARIK
jgi:hypothetical protein